jgi:putative colanic acid biosynthesis glycosyltransferase
VKILQINTTVNSGSTGRIAEEIGRVLIKEGHESYIAYGRGFGKSKSNLIKIGNKFDVYFHGLYTMVTDKHGFASKRVTKELIKQIERIKPDVIGLHNLHGYYLNIELLFSFISEHKIPVLWTLHDCWTFTGHCSYFDSVNCEKWKIQCCNCPKTRFYPASYLFDNSKSNYLMKKEIFNSFNNIQLITPSNWLNKLVKMSFLKHNVKTIYNGVNLVTFRPHNNIVSIRERHFIGNKFVVLGVASIWDKRKGLADFIELFKIVDNGKIQIVIIGLSKKQMTLLPGEIIGIERTENLQQLAEYYSLADVFVNPTWQDNFPTTNIESLACGTPVITYNTGGSAEAIDENTGLVVEKGDIAGLKNAIDFVLEKGKVFFTFNCRKRAERFFDKNEKFAEYLNMYENLIKNKEI